ncbi:hypothetical protein KEM52_004823 [Ascosphaera acerosa]|nr:hypothetical protein KEM52_004823 [Ascosphaera acerosa]
MASQSCPRLSLQSTLRVTPISRDQPRSRDVITLFHSPALRSSQRALELLQRAAAAAQEGEGGKLFSWEGNREGKETQEARSIPATDFELEVTTAPPTEDQLGSIFDYLGAAAAVPAPAAQVVRGARDREDALRKVLADQSRFIRPVVVDWSNGRAVLGGDESQIIRMLRELK